MNRYRCRCKWFKGIVRSDMQDSRGKEWLIGLNCWTIGKTILIVSGEWETRELTKIGLE